jgi:hypothetical protein
MKFITCLAIVFIGVAFSNRATHYEVSLVDREGLTLTNGVYGNIINGQSFQQDALISYKGWQYITYYNAARHVCIGRRKLPNGPWQIIRFNDYHFSHARNQYNDSHNTISMGICKKDGTIHLAFDHHASNLHYRVSGKGILDKPASIVWDSTLFSPVRDYLETGKPVTLLTYPAFVSAPNGDLLLGYRKGGSNDASYYLGEYDGAWKNFHEIISGKGDYNDPFKGISPSRNAYLNGLTFDAKGKLHTSWTWREKNEGVGNRDICYAWSSDGGNTWRNTYNQVIGTANGVQVMNTFAKDVTVQSLDRGWGNMNSQSQTVDRNGTPHVVMYHRSAHGEPEWARFNKDAAYFHYYRKADGSWQQIKTTVIGNRPKLVCDKKNNLYLVYIKKDHFDSRSEAAPLAIAKATSAAQWTDWKEVFVSKENYFNEPQVDAERWASEQVLSVLVQDAPVSTGAASAVRVVDLVLK